MNKRKSQLIYQSNIFLKYININAEDHYQNYQQELMNKQFITLNIFLALIFILYFLNNIIWFQDNFNAIIRLGQFLLSIISIIIARKYKSIMTGSLILQEMIHILLTTEFFYLFRQNLYSSNHVLEKSQFFSFGSNLTIIIFSITLVTKKWYYKTIEILMIIYTLLRLNPQFEFANLINQLFLIQFGVIFYLQERTERNHFFNYFEQRKNINELKFFINQLMPAPCFVISKHNNDQLKISYYNDKTLQEFKIVNSQDIIKKCEQFCYQPNNQLQNTIFSNNSDQEQKQQLIQIIKQELDILTKQQQQNKNIKEIIQSINYELYEELTLINCQYSDNSQITDKFYDIKLVQCIWDREPSLMIMLNNISQKIINDRLVAADEYKNQLLASVTHDLKNPLNGMVTMLQSCNQSTNIEQIQNMISIILKHTQLFTSLINDILDYSQIIKGKLRLVPSIFNISQLVVEIFELFKYSAQQKGIELNIEYKQLKNKCLTIYSDETRLNNAMKFTYIGSITIILEDDQDYENCIRIKVKDTGVGIPQNIQGQLFQAFATFDDKKGSNKQGIGLGLHICKRIVKELGPLDQLDLKSYQNQGSVFSFIIYRDISIKHIFTKSDQQIQSAYNIIINNQHQQENFQLVSIQEISIECYQQKEITKKQLNYKNSKLNQEKLLQQQQSNSCKNVLKREHSCIINSSQGQLDDKKPCIKNQRILIVDDEQFNIYGLTSILRQYENLDIDSALNGQIAIEKIKQAQQNNNQYNMVITDINMPILNGIEEIIKIKELIQNKTIDNIIIVSATSDIDDQQKSINVGANLILNKPINFNELNNILKQIIYQ